MKFLASLAVVALAVSSCVACASVPPPVPPAPVDSRTPAERAKERSVAMVEDSHANCGGVWVSPDAILTAFHCVDDTGKPPSLASIPGLFESLGSEVPPSLLAMLAAEKEWDPTGLPVFYADRAGADAQPMVTHLARIERFDRGLDLALLRAPDAPAHDFAHVGRVPKDGDDLDIVGSPWGNPFVYTRGWVAATRAPLGSAHDRFRRLEFTAHVQAGDSGGGVFDSRGDLVGITDELETRVYGEEGVPLSFGLAIAVHRDSIAAFLAAGTRP